MFYDSHRVLALGDWVTPHLLVIGLLPVTNRAKLGWASGICGDVFRAFRVPPGLAFSFLVRVWDLGV